MEYMAGENLRSINERDNKISTLNLEINNLKNQFDNETQKYARIMTDNEANFRQLQHILEIEKKNSETLRNMISQKNNEIESLHHSEGV